MMKTRTIGIILTLSIVSLSTTFAAITNMDASINSNSESDINFNHLNGEVKTDATVQGEGDDLPINAESTNQVSTEAKVSTNSETTTNKSSIKGEINLDGVVDTVNTILDTNMDTAAETGEKGKGTMEMESKNKARSKTSVETPVAEANIFVKAWLSIKSWFSWGK